MKVHYTHCIPPTCFGHSCGHLQGGALQRLRTSKYNKFLVTHKYKILNFKNNTWFKVHIKGYITDENNCESNG
jgi:hypothetical protein